MAHHRTLMSFAAVVSAAILLLGISTACGVASPVSSPPPSPAASKAASSPSTSSSASPSSGAVASQPAASVDPEYQKALDDFKKVQETARSEGAATIYSVIDADLLEKLQTAFNKIDPKIQVKLIRMLGAQAIERVRSEQSTKQFITSAYLGTMPQMAEEGLLQTFDFPVLHDKSIKWLVDPLIEKPAPLLVTNINKLLLMYNTQLVSDAEAPKTWRELADPKWKDKIVMWEPRISSYTMTLFGGMYYDPNYGPDFVKKVALNIRVSPDSAEPARLVAKGEVPVALTAPGTFATVRDAPVKAVAPTDGAYVAPSHYMIMKNAPQYNTALVFANWLLGPEGQKVISEGYGSVRSDVKGVMELAQLQPNEKLLPGMPFTAEYQKKVRGEPVKVFTQWMNDAGK